MTNGAPSGFLGWVARVSRQKDEKSAVAMLSVVSNTALVAFKLAIGVLIGSVSVISEAVHSGVDLAAAVIALFAVRTAARPADESHSFGHGKFENLSGAVEALLIFAAAAWIVHEALHKLVQPGDIEMAGWGVVIMLVSCLVNLGVSRMLFRVGRRADSVALLADAWHLRTDVYTSAGVMAGLSLYSLGRKLFPSVDLRWLDPVAAIAVALLIIRAAYDLTAQSVRDLLDQSLPDEEVRVIRERVRGVGPAARSFRNLRTRKAGAVRFVEMELVVDPGMSVVESHAVADLVAARIRGTYPGAEVTVHIEPCASDCSDDCRVSCPAPADAEKGRS
ncbi:MAG: cation transporter [Elusimicrobia bacterium]|nr:cation transporter [Elusimicrobiota bacterium]